MLTTNPTPHASCSNCGSYKPCFPGGRVRGQLVPSLAFLRNFVVISKELQLSDQVIVKFHYYLPESPAYAMFHLGFFRWKGEAFHAGARTLLSAAPSDVNASG